MINEPLGLPKGTVRAVLALLLVCGFVVSCYVDIASNDARIALAGIAGVVVTYYFRQREDEAKQS